MPSFFDRLKRYYEAEGDRLKNVSDTAPVFMNRSDLGTARELAYAEFLVNHLPSTCRTSLGGFVFNLNGEESRQIDIIITSDSTPQFMIADESGLSKAFSCVEGTLGVVTLKSHLNTNQLEDCLNILASIPEQGKGRVNSSAIVRGIENWPLKIVYALSSVAPNSLMHSLSSFYEKNRNIPQTRRPDLIHVNGEFVIVKSGLAGGSFRGGVRAPADSFVLQPDVSNVYGLGWIVYNMQMCLNQSRQIFWDYSSLADKVSIS